MTTPGFDHDLSTWLDARAPAHAPEHLLGATVHRTARTQPRPAWRIPARWRPLTSGRGPVPGALRRGMAGGLLLLLLAALLIVATLLPLAGSGPEPVTPRLGADMPEGTRSGVIDTPIGPARWVRLTGDASTLPPWVFPGEDATFTADETRRDDEGEPTERLRWSSTDAMRWTTEPLPLPTGAGSSMLHEGASASWQMTWQPSGLLRSTDGRDWQPVDLSGAVPAGPAAFTWDIEPNGIESAGPATLVHLVLRPIEPFETLGWPAWDTRRVQEVEPGVIGIRGRGDEGDGPGRLLRFEPIPDGLRAIEVADGSVVADLPGVTYEHVLGWIREGGPVHDVLALVEGDRVMPTSLPLSYLGDPVGSSLGTIRGTPDGFRALVLEAQEGPARLWRSADGREWEDLGRWDLPVGEPGGAYYIGDVYGQFHAEYHPPMADNLERAWRSDDGLHWTQIWADIPSGSNIIELASGTIAQQWLDEGGAAWWASADGSTWQPLDLSGLELDVEGGDLNLGEAGDTGFVIVTREDGRRDMWVLSFDTAPAA